MRPEFDKYAKQYREMHQRSIGASGEAPEYFHRYKAEWLVEHFGERVGVGRADEAPILDFGAGIGNLTIELTKRFRTVEAYDPSGESIEIAKERAPEVRCYDARDELPEAHYGLVILANVLHHVAIPERTELVQFAASRLRSGGVLVLWEHNPLNPLSRRAVRDCPFDENAVLLWPSELRALLCSAALTQLRRDWVVFFPAWFAKLRGLEPRLRRVPFGAQCVMTGIRR